MFSAKGTFEKANKYDYAVDMEKYGPAIEWYENAQDICVTRDREKLLLLMDLNEKIEDAEIIWLQKHKEDLDFDCRTEDKGFAFVDILTIFHKGNALCTKWFFGDGEADDFMNLVSA